MAVAVSLTAGTPAEHAVASQLAGFFARFDLTPWEFTTAVVIDESAPFPHSHPVLTLNARNGGTFLLGAYLHEQLHWFCTSRWDTVSTLVTDELPERYPSVPVGFPLGCRDEESTYLHLLVCWLELDALRTLLGTDEATAHIERVTEVGVYRWVYATVARDFDTLATLYEPLGLRIVP